MTLNVDFNLKTFRASIRRTFQRGILNKSLRANNKTSFETDSPNRTTYMSLDNIASFDMDETDYTSSSNNKKTETAERMKHVAHMDNTAGNTVRSETSNAISASKDNEPKKKSPRLRSPRSKSEAVAKLLQNSCNNKENDLTPPPLHPMSFGLIRKWTISAYRAARDEIYYDIAYNYRSSLIVWCPLLEVRCDLVDTLLPKFGETIMVYDRWIPDEYNFSPKVWGGVVVAYSSRSEAKKAAKAIPMKHEFMKTLELSKLLYCLVKSEVRNDLEGDSRITVIAETSTPDYLQELKRLICMFGRVTSCQYYVIRKNVYLYEVTYSFATHAFLAATVLDGLPFGHSLLKAKIIKTVKEKAILNDLQFAIKKFVGNAYFPFRGFS